MRKSNNLKTTIKVSLLVFVLLFLVWSVLQPTGILATLQNNIWSIDLLNRVLTAPDQITQISVPPTNPHSAVILARQAVKEEQLEFAEQSILPLLSYQDRAMQNTYAEVLYSTGRKSEAFGIWEKFDETIILERAANQSSGEGDDQSVLEAYRSLYRLDPEKYTSNLALTLMVDGQYTEAEQLFLLSRGDYSDSEYASNWLRYLADSYVSRRNWQKAEEIYRQTVQENPSDLRAWRNLGLLYSNQMNMPQKAIECFQEMVSRFPGETYGYSYLAQLYEKIGDFENALETYQSLLLISPDDTTALQAVQRLSNEENPNP